MCPHSEPAGTSGWTEDQEWPLRHKRKILAHHLGHIKNVGSLFGAPEVDFASCGSTQLLPNPFNFWPARCLGFRNPGAQSKGRLQHHFRFSGADLAQPGWSMRRPPLAGHPWRRVPDLLLLESATPVKVCMGHGSPSAHPDQGLCSIGPGLQHLCPAELQFKRLHVTLREEPGKHRYLTWPAGLAHCR